jgi:hypothetical protein
MGEIMTLKRAREAGQVSYVLVYRIGSVAAFKSGSRELTGIIMSSQPSYDQTHTIYTIKVGDDEHQVMENDVTETEFVRLL